MSSQSVPIPNRTSTPSNQSSSSSPPGSQQLPRMLDLSSTSPTHPTFPPFSTAGSIPAHTSHSNSEGSIEVPRNYILPSPLSVYQHIRRSSTGSTNTNEYSFGPSSPPIMSPTNSSIISGSDTEVSTPNSATSPLSSSGIWPGLPPSNSVAALRRAQSLSNDYEHRCLGHGECLCSRHHHRRNSVAIKFSPTYLEDPFYEDEVMKENGCDNDDLQARNDAYGRALRRHSSSALRRPPTPIAERILKGDFSF